MVKTQALEGIRILDFSWVGAGPIVAKLLGDFGATVIKVESTKYVDFTRVSGPFKDGIIDVNRSGLFIGWNSSKYSITLDLSNPQGLAVAKRLVVWADAVLENFGPGAMKRMGLNYEELRKIKSDIIMASSSTLGQTGPMSEFRGFGPAAAALAAHFHLTGWADREPTGPGTAWADMIQPLFTASAIMAAIDHRKRTGKGQYLDVSQLECAVHFIAPAVLDYAVNKRQNRMGNRNPYAAPHGAFRCKGTDSWCTIAVFTDEEWDSLCEAIGNPSWTKDAKFTALASRKENEEELEGLIEEWTINYSPQEVMVRLQEVGVPAGVVQNSADLADHDPQLKERHSFIPLQHPVMGLVRYPAPPFRLSMTPAELGSAPCLGEHNEYVCTQILGMSDEEFVKLVNAGVFT